MKRLVLVTLLMSNLVMTSGCLVFKSTHEATLADLAKLNGIYPRRKQRATI